VASHLARLRSLLEQIAANRSAAEAAQMGETRPYRANTDELRAIDEYVLPP